MTADSFSTTMTLVGPAVVGRPSKKDQRWTSLQTCRNSSLMAWLGSGQFRGWLTLTGCSEPRRTWRVPEPGISSLTNALDPEPRDMEMRAVTMVLESAPLCGVPRKYRL